MRVRALGSVVLLFCAMSLGAQTPPAGVLIRGGELIDGTGAPARRADVRVAGDRIVEIGPGLTARPGEKVLDAAGKVVAPGFIDMHSHADRAIERADDVSSQVFQGITTAIVGQDGGGSLPVSDFLDDVDQAKPAINYATSIGHGTVRRAVMGADFKRAATSAEIETMKALVERGMKDGALGLSSGLEYDPGFYAKPDELVALATVAAKHGGYYASHVRDEENTVLDAWTETINVGRAAKIPVVISHIKMASKPVWGKTTEGLRLLEQAAKSGVKVMADWYPYTYWQSSMYVLIPDRDFENRAKWEVGLDEIGGAQNVLVTGYRPDPSLNGRTVAEIANALGKDPVTTIIEMIRAAGPNIGIIGTSMDEADLARFAAHPLVLICSDGAPGGRHPRGYGAFPRVLAKYVRADKVLPLHEAIAKMTGRSAAHVGLSDRGTITAGKKADIVVFDPATIQDLATPQQPQQNSVGMLHVLVNGEVVLDSGSLTQARAGRAVRRPSAAPVPSQFDR